MVDRTTSVSKVQGYTSVSSGKLTYANGEWGKIYDSYPVASSYDTDDVVGFLYVDHRPDIWLLGAFFIQGVGLLLPWCMYTTGNIERKIYIYTLNGGPALYNTDIDPV